MSPLVKDNTLQEKLLEQRLEAEEREAERKAAKFKLPYVDLVKIPIQDKALALIQEEEAKSAMAAGFKLKSDGLALAVLDPESLKVKEIVKKLEGEKFKVQLFIVSPRGLKHAWSSYKFVFKEQKEITGKVEIESGNIAKLTSELDTLKEVGAVLKAVDKNSTSKVVEIILAGALANRSSDIHLEPAEKTSRLRYRIDGLIYDVAAAISKEVFASLILRIKLLSNLKINIHDEPQDGRFTIGFGEKNIEIRTSIIPSEYGESAVLRILDPKAAKIKLEDLGWRKDDLQIIERDINKPNGLILNTGPTGSGKTTTLYAFLSKVYSPEMKIITIEDPIEYHLEGISQTQVDPEAGYTFASGLRSILRQDPDIILVGEIRDAETAGIAMNAALTGHLVFSTLHTNDAIGAVPRLLDLGAKPPILAPALSLVIAQRLVRRLCENCKKEKKIDPALQSQIRNFINKLPDRVEKKSLGVPELYEARGCLKCGSLGYLGRVGIFELRGCLDWLECAQWLGTLPRVRRRSRILETPNPR